MRRVIQRTIKTTKIISLTITHSEEEVEYTLTTGTELPDASEPEPLLLGEADASAAPADPTDRAENEAVNTEDKKEDDDAPSS